MGHRISWQNRYNLKYNLTEVQIEINQITKLLKEFLLNSRTTEFEDNLLKELYKFNNNYFPYVGLINYHEQHAYAYDLFGFDRKDDLEIGPLYKGQGKEAKQAYLQSISDVLNNCKKFLVDDYNIFIVANDKYNIYPVIAENSGMQIINQYKRPVLNRTEKDKCAYSEIIFHLKKKL